MTQTTKTGIPVISIGDVELHVLVLLTKAQSVVLRTASMHVDMYNLAITNVTSVASTPEEIAAVVAQLEAIENAAMPHVVAGCNTIYSNAADFDFETLSFDSVLALYHAGTQAQQRALLGLVTGETGAPKVG